MWMLKLSRRRARQSQKFFRDEGEQRFRDLETTLIGQLAKGPAAVVSLGGGAVIRDENRRMIQDSGRCVWLDTEVDTILERLAADQATQTQRPGLTDLAMADEVRQLMTARRPLYEAVSEHRIDTTTKSIDQVANEIKSWLLA